SPSNQVSIFPSLRLLLPELATEASQRHQRKVMRVELVVEIEVIWESVAGRLRLVPRAGIVLPGSQPANAAQYRLGYLILAGEQRDQSPRGLRRGAGATPSPRAIGIGERALAPSAVFILLRLDPLDGALNPRLAHVRANSPQPG